MKKIKVKLTFVEPVLGTWPSNQNIAREFIASKSPDAATVEDEVAALGADAVADKGMTVFPRNEKGEPVLYDYQVKGFFKDSCGMLSRIGGKTETGKKKAVNESGKITAYKKVIDTAQMMISRTVEDGRWSGRPTTTWRVRRSGQSTLTAFPMFSTVPACIAQRSSRKPRCSARRATSAAAAGRPSR